ncbi:MAG: acyltransferase, partial [Conexibacter sp.]|nr:acyltransferase [Conexibacter sp.]
MSAPHAHAVEPAVAPPPGNPRFAPVDGLRAVAAMAVLITHTAFLSGFNGHGFPGQITARLDSGVALFFVISGFLLYRPFVAARLHGRPGPTIRRYARRRIIRIVPAYWLALTVLAIWPGLPLVHGHDFWVYYLFLQDFTVNWAHGGIGAAWSLGVEVQFYVFLPFFALGLARLVRGRAVRTQLQVEYAVLAGLAAISLGVRAWSFVDKSPDTISQTILGTFLWFALGMGLAVTSARWHDVPVAERPAPLRLIAERPLLLWAAAAALLVGVSQSGMPVLSLATYTLRDWMLGHVLYGMLAVCFAAPIMLGVDGRGGVPERLLTLRPIAWLGLISYGIFLWHHPLTGKFIHVQDWTTHGSSIVYTLAVFLAATTAATLSYYLLERPLLRFKDPRPRLRPPSSPAPEDLR